MLGSRANSRAGSVLKLQKEDNLQTEKQKNDDVEEVPKQKKPRKKSHFGQIKDQHSQRKQHIEEKDVRLRVDSLSSQDSQQNLR
jgi:hypothetical protein